MTPRERIHTTLRHIEPDSVPFNMWLVDEVAEQFGGMQAFAEQFNHSTREVELSLPDKPEDVPVTEWVPRPRAEDVGRKGQFGAMIGPSDVEYVLVNEASEWKVDAALTAKHCLDTKFGIKLP